jgi:hypothetical protein
VTRAKTFTHDPAAEAPVTEDGTVVLQCASSTLSGTKLSAMVAAYNGTGFYTGSLDLMNARQCAAFATPAAAAYHEANPEAPALKATAMLGALQRLALGLTDIHSAAGGTQLTKKEASGNARDVLSLRVPGLVCVGQGDTGGLVFILLRDGGLAVEESVLEPAPDEHQEGTRYLPPPTLPWLLPRANEVTRHWEDLQDDPQVWLSRLLADVEAWHTAASDLGRTEAYLMLALYTMATYAIAVLDYLAILLLEAEAERGKSRTGQAWQLIARHGIWLQGVREANLLRDANDRRASLFIDLMDAWKRFEDAGCTDVLMGRWERGAVVERVIYPDKGAFLDTVTYDVFSGGTVIGTNENVHRILQSRCLIIDMPLSSRTFSNRPEPEAARALVERLNAWQAYVLAHGLQDCDPPADGRLGDILRPLRRVLLTVAPHRLDEFNPIVNWQVQRRRDDLATTTEALVVKAMLAQGDMEAGSAVALPDVLASVNETLPDTWKKTARWLGGKLRKLGWKIERVGKDNHSVVWWDADLLLTLGRRYGLTQEHIPPAFPDNVSHVSPVSPSSGGAATHCPAGVVNVSPTCRPETGPLSSGEEPAATRATHTTRSSGVRAKENNELLGGLI